MDQDVVGDHQRGQRVGLVLTGLPDSARRAPDRRSACALYARNAAKNSASSSRTGMSRRLTDGLGQLRHRDAVGVACAFDDASHHRHRVRRRVEWGLVAHQISHAANDVLVAPPIRRERSCHRADRFCASAAAPSHSHAERRWFDPSRDHSYRGSSGMVFRGSVRSHAKYVPNASANRALQRAAESRC
jgi:hypothetical protein